MFSLRANANHIPLILSPLEKFETDKYLIAFGPDSKQFVATPNGYTA
jgi:hypothetical protein